MNRGFGVLLLVAFAVSIVGYPGSSSYPRVPRPEAVSTAGTTLPSDAATTVSPEVCGLSQDLSCGSCSGFCPLQTLLETIRASFADEPDTEAARHLNVPKDLWDKVKFAVALVPDPAHTHLSLFFDRSIDAIEQAAQQGGYIFDRATMPWDPQNHPEVADFRMRMRQAQYEKEREKVPGMMIFRKAYPDANDYAPLFVLVVGETPTGGIHKEQFKNALRAIMRIRTGATAALETPEALRIMGPTFSGSLFSLSELLRQTESEDFSPVLIHSGTASSWRTINWFEQNTCINPNGAKDRAVQFVTFQESDRYSIRRFIRFAEAQGYEAGRIAVLSEEETAYGSEMFDFGTTPPRCPGSSSESDPTTQEAKIVQLYFPRDISQLRSAYQRDLPAEESSEAGGRRPSRSTLRLNLEDTGSDADSVPEYSRLQTPLSQEAVLLGIVTNLQKHLSQFVVIRATNPLDQLFLTRYLRTAYPEGRIVTSGADMLFRREVENNLLQGTLAITSYSMVPGADDEVAYPDPPEGKSQSGCSECEPDRRPGAHSDSVFPHPYSTGSYNAMLSLLACLNPSDPKSKQECASNDLPSVPRYAEYGWPDVGGTEDKASSVLAPPLSLTALGHYGYWRLALLDSQAYARYSEPHTNLHAINSAARKMTFVTYVPQPWKLFCGVFSSFVLTFLFIMWRGSVVSASEAIANLAPIPDQSRRWVLCLVGLLLLTMLLMAVGPWIRWKQRFCPPEWLYWFAVLGLLLVFRWIIELRRREAERARNAKPVALWTFTVPSLVLAIAAVCFYSLGPDAQKNLFLYRYVQFSSGLSPALPWLLLIASLLWWAWYSLAGLALLDQRRPRLPRVSSLRQLGSVHLTEEANARLLSAARPFSRDPRVYLPALLVGGISFVIVNYRHPVQSLEGKTYDRGYGFALGLCILWLLCTAFRLAVVWLECRRLLLALDSLPLRRSFRWLTGFSWKPIWRLRGSILQDSFRIIEREMESLRNLSNVLVKNLKFAPDLPTAISLTHATGNVLAARNTVNDDYAAARALEFRLWPFLREFGKSIRRKLSRKQSGGEPPVDSEVASTAQRREKAPYDLLRNFKVLQKRLAKTCGLALTFLSDHWNLEERTQLVEDTPPHDKKKAASDEKSKQEADQDKANLPLETRLAEEFVCLVYVNFILSVLMRMRTLVMSILGMFVLILLSVAGYPFEPKQPMYSMLIILFLVIVGFVGVVYAQMHRDATLSRITDTTPGELGFDFWIRIAGFTAVPLLSLLLAQYPEFNNFLFSWLQPVLQGPR